MIAVDEDQWPPPPRHNAELIGHEAAESSLINSFDSNTLPHAWLITGPRGVGKATLAYRFARFLLSKGGNSNMQTGMFVDALPADKAESLYIAPESPVFRRIAAGGHADFLSVERGLNERGKPRTEIIVDDVRSIGAFLNLTSAEGGWRVVVIDSADDMNRNAANAVLKVLEEPPSGVLLLLVSHNPGRLLPTIRSRCRKLVLKPLKEDVVADLVLKYSPGMAFDDASQLARLSEGSIGRALSLVEEGGLELYRELLQLLKSLPDLDAAALHKFGDRVGKSGADDAFRVVSDLLRWWIGRLVLMGAGNRAESGGGDSADEQALMARMISAGGLDRWLEVWEKINNLLERTESAYLDRKQVILSVFLTLETTVRP